MANIENQSESGIILDRRQLITGASALGLSAVFGSMPAMAQGAPKKGGVLRLGMEGGSPSDSLDPMTFADSIPITMSLMLYNNLIEVKPAVLDLLRKVFTTDLFNSVVIRFDGFLSFMPEVSLFNILIPCELSFICPLN